LVQDGALHFWLVGWDMTLFDDEGERINEQIRTKILDKANCHQANFLMVVKNNYFWLKDSDHAGFIGDIIEVLEIISRNNSLSLPM
jgi:hypothetical protein